MTKRNDFAIEQDLRTINFTLFERGLCAADPTILDQKERDLRRERGWYSSNVLNTVNTGAKEGRDDRKLRVHKLEVKQVVHEEGTRREYTTNNLIVYTGMSHYGAFAKDRDRSVKDSLALQARGEADYNDKWACFQRNPGVAGLIIDRKGGAWLGTRTSDDDHGLLAATAGHMKYHTNPSNIKIYDDLHREMGEFGVQFNNVITERLVGIYSNPIRGDMDFTALIYTSLDPEYFVSGAWKEVAKSLGEKEHKNLVRVEATRDIEYLLETGFLPGHETASQLQYSTRGALMALLEERKR